MLLKCKPSSTENTRGKTVIPEHIWHKSILLVFLKYKFIYFNRRLITLQYCIGFAIHQHESATGIHVLSTHSCLKPLNITIPYVFMFELDKHLTNTCILFSKTMKYAFSSLIYCLSCVYLWRIHVDVWQNQYNIVK